MTAIRTMGGVRVFGGAAAAGLIPLAEVRARAAAALAPASDGDPSILEDVVDAVEPPAIMLLWADPWLDGDQVVGGCLWYGRLEVRCIAGRLEPGPGVSKLEELVGYAIGRLEADDYAWPFDSLMAPRVLVINGVNLLAARLIYRVPISI